jgi:hypothetical protein
MRVPASVLLLLMTLSCSSPSTSPPEPSESGLEPRRTADGLTLINPTDRTIYYAVFEREWAEKGLFIWGQCTDAPRCPSIPPRGSVRIPLSEVNGYNPRAREARVYYWFLVPEPNGGYRVTDMRSLVAPL